MTEGVVQVVDALVDRYNEIKMIYSEHMSISDLNTFVHELKAHTEKIAQSVTLAKSLNVFLKPEWDAAIRESNEAAAKITQHINELARAGTGPAKSILSNVFQSHGNLIRWIDMIEDQYGNEFKNLAISLPKIVVVGEENVGKSSVLESIAGTSIFPRAEGICTRLPFQMRMHQRTPEKMMNLYGHYYKENPALAMDQTFVSFEDDPTNFLTAPEVISNKVSEITKKKTGGVGVKDEVVVLNLYSAKVADLTLVDLPGIISANRMGEPEDIYETTLKIVQDYIRSPDTIVLAVIPATMPPSNSQALREVQRAKALNRTVAVITKVDLASARDKVDLRILGSASDSVVLPFGYIGVINTDTVVKQNFTEEEFFQRNFPDLWAKEKVGCVALTKQLNLLLDRHIRTVWAPNTKQIILKKQEQVKKQHDNLGKPVPSSNAKEFFQHELGEFSTEITKQLEIRQPELFRALTEKIKLLAYESKKSKKPQNKKEIVFELVTLANQKIEGYIKNCMENCKLSRFPAIWDYVLSVYREQSSAPNAKCEEILMQIVDIDSTPLPDSVSQHCSVEENKQPETCLTCQEVLTDVEGGGVVSLRCTATANHTMHVSCFVKFMKSGGHNATMKCPACRTIVPAPRLEKPVSSLSDSLDPVLLFTLKAIDMVEELRSRLGVALESKFKENIQPISDHDVSLAFSEASTVSASRKKYQNQLEVLRGALSEIIKYSQ